MISMHNRLQIVTLKVMGKVSMHLKERLDTHIIRRTLLNRIPLNMAHFENDILSEIHFSTTLLIINY